MAAIENLEIVVDVDIASAIAQLEELQDELQNVAEKIEAVDAIGQEGIDIRTHVDDLDTELARLQGEIMAFEAANSIDIDTDVDDEIVFPDVTDAPALPPPDFGSHTRVAGNVIPDHFASMAQAEVDFGGFNVPREFGGRMSDRDDLFRRFRRRLSSLSDKFNNVRNTLDEFDIRMSDIHNTLATLVPLLFVFIGAIPAVVTALVGLATAAVTAAAALATLAGLGALGVGMEGGEFQMENLTEVWEQIQEDFIEAFAPLAERLEPLFRDAVDGLGRLFQAIANQGDALMELTDEARAFGGFIMDFVPDALRTLAALVEALSPIFAQIGRAISENFEGAMRTLVQLTAEAIPAVARLVQTIVKALPTIVRIGIQFAHWANIILETIGVVWEVITVFGALDGAMGHLIALGLVFASTVALLNKALIGLAIKGIWNAITGLVQLFYALAASNTQMALFGSTTLGAALSGLVSFTASIIRAIPVIGSLISSLIGATMAAAAFWSVVTLGAAAIALPAIADMATGFLGLSDSIDAATSSLKDFDRVSSRTSGNFNPYEGENPPTDGAAAATGGRAQKTVINIESSGDPNEDASNARYASFRQGRTTGGTN